MKRAFVLFLIILSGCNNQGKTVNEKDSQTKESNTSGIKLNNNQSIDTITTFDNYIGLMPSLMIPVKITCDDQPYPIPDLYNNRSYGRMFRPEGAAIIGKLRTTNKYVAIIYAYPADISLPILETYTLEGVKLDQLQLFNLSSCVTDFNDTIETNSSFLIFENFDIKIIDSIFNTTTHTDGNIVRTFKQTNVKKYMIDDSGMITK
jgi:hypothetical protein